MRAEERGITRTQMTVLGPIIAALRLGCLFAQPRILGQSQASPETRTVQQSSGGMNASK